MDRDQHSDQHIIESRPLTDSSWSEPDDDRSADNEDDVDEWMRVFDCCISTRCCTAFVTAVGILASLLGGVYVWSAMRSEMVTQMTLSSGIRSHGMEWQQHLRPLVSQMHLSLSLQSAGIELANTSLPLLEDTNAFLGTEMGSLRFSGGLFISPRQLSWPEQPVFLFLAQVQGVASRLAVVGTNLTTKQVGRSKSWKDCHYKHHGSWSDSRCMVYQIATSLCLVLAVDDSGQIRHPRPEEAPMLGCIRKGTSWVNVSYRPFTSRRTLRSSQPLHSSHNPSIAVTVRIAGDPMLNAMQLTNSTAQFDMRLRAQVQALFGIGVLLLLPSVLTALACYYQSRLRGEGRMHRALSTRHGSGHVTAELYPREGRPPQHEHGAHEPLPPRAANLH